MRESRLLKGEEKPFHLASLIPFPSCHGRISILKPGALEFE